MTTETKVESATAELGSSCSFCGKSKDDVAILVIGNAAAICDDCIFVSANIAAEKYITDRMAESRKERFRVRARPAS